MKKNKSKVSHFAKGQDEVKLGHSPSIDVNSDKLSSNSQQKEEDKLLQNGFTTQQVIDVVNQQEMKLKKQLSNKRKKERSPSEKYTQEIADMDEVNSQDNMSEGDNLSQHSPKDEENPSQVSQTKTSEPTKKKGKNIKIKKEKTPKHNDNKSKIKQKYQINDLNIKNSVGRNILHRSCLKQNHKMIEDLIKQFESLKLEEEKQQKMYPNYFALNFENQETVKEQVLNYVNLIDLFGNTPIILCCIQEQPENNHRAECIQALLDSGADATHRNPRTFWTALHWCSHYGDFKSVALLISHIIPVSVSRKQEQIKTYQCFPDEHGYFPIDLAGINKHGDIVNILIESIIEEISLVENNPAKHEEKESQHALNMMYYKKEDDQEFMSMNRKKYLLSSLLKSRVLFWAAYYPCEKSMKFIQDVFSFNQTYIMVKQPHVHDMTSLHAAAKMENLEILSFLAENILLKNCPNKLSAMEHQYKDRVTKEYSFVITDNSILSLMPREISMYKDQFINAIRSLAEWENQFILNFRKVKQLNKNLYIDQQDLFGNTALHLASINGFVVGVANLLENGADMEVDNKEGWRPRELVQHSNVRALYQNAVDTNEGISNQLRPMNKELEVIIRKYNEIDLNTDFKNPKEKELYAFATKLFLPDFVIVFSLGQNQLGESNQNRMNFQIGVLKKSGFNVYLLESVFPDKYFLLIGLPEKEIQLACKQNKMQMKLVDSYDYEPFSLETKTRFEPFRSKQRQEIIEMQLNKIINLQDLKSQGLISSYYKMHTYGGISRIKFQWVDDPFWWWPQPLNQIDDYLLEAQDQNFTSVTLLRQYFGEQIAFFFGWKSFITCFLILIAVPGLALQIYIIQEGSTDYNNILISFWVLYVMIWSTIIVEFWKRKTSEINYRWGTLDEMNNPDIIKKQLRDDFIGDECISGITGGLTKYERKSKTVIKLLISIPVLCGLMFLVVYIFLIVDDFKKSITSSTDKQSLSNNLFKTLAGVFQGVGIQVLNFVYTFIARKFAQYENHKYVFQYERSIIYKLMAFKVLNSYFALFYVAFLQSDSNFETLFFMLLPILLVKQINYTIFNVWMPLFFYKRSERSYFQKVFERVQEHQLSQGQNDQLRRENEDVIEQFWNSYSKEDMLNLNRIVLSVSHDKDQPESSDSSIKMIKTMDADSIELNSLRGEFLDTINFYSDGFIDLGYITLFASSFPIGPSICLIMNSLEIRNKLNAFMFVLKRPTCQRSAGIGEWLFIWEFFSYASVIMFLLLLLMTDFVFGQLSNIGLLYQKDEKLINLFIDKSKYTDQEITIYKTWVYICFGIAIILLKYFFQAVISDKPEWIRKIEEMWGHQERIEKEANDKILQVALKNKEQDQIKREKDAVQVKKIYETKIATIEEEIMQLQDQREFYRSHCKPEQQIYRPDSEGDIHSGAQSKILKNRTEFQMKVYSALNVTYTNIERELLIKRMSQLEKMNFGTIVLCNECGKALSVIDCQDCDQDFCQKCFNEYHSFIKANNHIVRILNKDSRIEIKDLDNYMIIEDDMGQDNEESPLNSEQENDKIKAKKYISKIDSNNWNKLEYFQLPTFKKSPQFFLLEDVFKQMYVEYIQNNGINETTEEIDIKKFFRLHENPEAKGKFVVQDSQEITSFLRMTEFNIEDKLFLNRIAFLVFKRNGSATTFTHFYSLCKILQDGYLEQKSLLLLDFIDEDDSQMIDCDEVKKIFYSSFLQAKSEDKKIDYVIDNLFKGTKRLNKLEIGKKFIYSNENDPLLNTFLVSLLQGKIK